MDAYPTGGVLSFLKDLPDPRGHNTRHSLMAVVTIALLAVMSGADDWVAVAAYGRCKERWLEDFLPLENGIPSSPTFRRVFAVLDPVAYESPEVLILTFWLDSGIILCWTNKVVYAHRCKWCLV